MFETERSLIRSLQKSDYVDVKKIYVNKEVRKYLGGIRQDDAIQAVIRKNN
ncbi:hypothetical protein [Bacillus mesophilum]|uniref:hypothetical protein n=1 Tax=Bacillus mesophilum TaxID=1071718 RepID=UPI001375C365|nr:hypothetical protein [Bacillus mesophilum]